MNGLMGVGAKNEDLCITYLMLTRKHPPQKRH